MAKVGLSYVVSGILDESGATPKYTGGRHWGPASTFNKSPNANNAEDYGDDHLVESDTSVSSVGLSIELNEPTLELESVILGHTYSEEDGMVSNKDDVAPWLGIGAIGKSMRNNKIIYRGIFYHKVKANEPSGDYNTKQQSTSFTHTTIEATAYALDDGAKGKMRTEKEFETEAAAKTWLNVLVGITASGS